MATTDAQTDDKGDEVDRLCVKYDVHFAVIPSTGAIRATPCNGRTFLGAGCLHAALAASVMLFSTRK